MKTLFVLCILFFTQVCFAQREVMAYVMDETWYEDTFGDIDSISITVGVDTLFANKKYYMASKDTMIRNKGSINILTKENPAAYQLYKRLLEKVGGRALKNLRAQEKDTSALRKIVVKEPKRKDFLSGLIDLQALKDSAKTK